MNTQGSGTEVLRFEIPVNGETYRSLVSGLRGRRLETQSFKAPRSAVRAQVDLDLSSRSYSVTTLGSHRLPSALRIKPGTRTHNSLTRFIVHSIRDERYREAAALIQDIIQATPHISENTFSICKHDIEISPRARASLTPSPIHTIQLISEFAPSISLDFDDVPTLVIPESQDELFTRAISTIRSELFVISPLAASTVGNTATLRATIQIPTVPGVVIDVFAHWGSYDELAPQWQDEPVTLQPAPFGNSTITHRLQIPVHGAYGATLFAQVQGTSERMWLGSMGSGDARFYIAHDDLEPIREKERALDALDAWCINTLSSALKDKQNLEPICEEILSRNPFAPLGELLGRACAEDPQSEQSAPRQSDTTPLTSSMILNYGVGEIVFATPEGPHAAAGGLAQVISGLPPELCKAGIPTTIITPLYRYANGNKHGEAQRVLTTGIKLGDATVIPSYVGSVTVNVGPTYHTGTSAIRRAPSAIPLKIYQATHENLRVFLLANPSVFDRLYQPVFADEQLRRAIIFSRATLETIAAKHLGIRPSAIISNDWMTACIPAFCALDPSYQNVPWLKSSKTIHMIHNGGADYHGRLPNNINHEDLWPMFNLAPDHFFGFRDPYNYDLLNFSMAAAQHASGGILTVSEPYAQQLVSPSGGDGLEYVLTHKRDRVFGISNGINRPQVDRYLSIVAGKQGEPFSSTDEFLASKNFTKVSIQERYGLTVSPHARLISFVGRMAEQKGLHLLSGFVEGRSVSTLEEILVRHPDTQILVAGPHTDGDSSCQNLRGTLDYLSALYPGRIRAVSDYVPHSTALEIIFGSTFFLMPSRFEPGGITQLEALAAGTLVVGRRVGGISSTIENFEPTSRLGNGFLCNDYTPTAFANTCHWALEVTRNSNHYRTMVESALGARHSWSDRIPLYREMLKRVVAS